VADLHTLIAAELDKPVQGEVADFAAHVAARFGGAARAVIFYGSCLREARLDGLMLDFYVIVSDYRAAYDRGWLARANRMIPPNVFPAEHDGLAAKYAVLDAADLRRLTGANAPDVSVWARFAQPVRLAWAADDAARALVAEAVSEAPVTLFRHAAPVAGSTDPMAIWRTGFTRTYGAELRAERGDRPDKVVDFDPEYYARVGAAVLAEHPEVLTGDRATAERAWRSLSARGKRTTILRLAKASLTFAGGIDYLAWKINRHAGTRIEIKPWQRRWPILGAAVMLPRLIRSGAVK